MEDPDRTNRLASKIQTAKEVPNFSEAQLKAFNSGKLKGLDDALGILDEANQVVIGSTKAFSENKAKDV